MSAGRDFYAALGVEIPDRPGPWIDVECFNPGHDHDRKPSCGVNIEHGGFNCEGCGAKGSAYDAAVLKGRAPKDAAELCKRHGLGSWDGQGRRSNGKREIVDIFDYVDESGGLLFQVVRLEPKDFRQRRPDGAGGWHWNLNGTRRVLYRLPKVVAAVEAGETVYITEGEKDAHALEHAGVTATCNPMGAGKWKPGYGKPLAGATVVLVADRDEPGRAHARQVAESLADIATSVTVVEPVEGKDAADHLGAGKTVEDFTPAPPGNDRTHRTDTANPHGERDSAFGRVPNALPNAPRTMPALALATLILDHFDGAMGELGLIGERHVARTAKLVQVSRLLRIPARLVTKGDSSTGKSFAVECANKTAAPETLYVRTSGSPTALFYSDESFEHRCLVFYEANRLADDDDPLAGVLRTLISENRLAHEVTVPEKRTTVLLEKDGPVAFITTTCKPFLGAELETRVLSLHSDNSDEMTRDVVRSVLLDAAEPRPEVDLSEWHQLDRWLADGPCEVVLPWAAALADSGLSGPPRLRRDITNLLSLARAHALLHRGTRELDERGHIISTLADYEVVRGLLSTAMAVATDRAARPGTREVVEAVAGLRSAGATSVSMSAASRRAGRSKSTTHTDIHDALERGYLVDRSLTPARFDLDVGDPLPDEDDLLPPLAVLAQAFGDRSVTVRSGTERANPHHERDSGDCSDRSVVSGGDGFELLEQPSEHIERLRAKYADNHEEGTDDD